MRILHPLLLILSSCASRAPVKPDAAWRPLAAEELLREKKADQLQTVFARYSVKLTLTVDAAGKITDHNIVEPSPEAVMNQIANTTIARIDPLPEPPVALLNRGYVKIVWVFNVERYRQ